MQITRRFEIVYVLLRKEIVTAAELAAHFEVSTRTIYRDIEALSQAGIPVYMRKGKGGGISRCRTLCSTSGSTKEEQREILAS